MCQKRPRNAQSRRALNTIGTTINGSLSLSQRIDHKITRRYIHGRVQYAVSSVGSLRARPAQPQAASTAEQTVGAQLRAASTAEQTASALAQSGAGDLTNRLRRLSRAAAANNKPPADTLRTAYAPRESVIRLSLARGAPGT